MRKLATSLTKTTRIAATLTALTSLTACLPERPHPPRPTDPVLNLITGCFDSKDGSGNSYLLIGCLNSSELASLTQHNPTGPVARTVLALKSEYAGAAGTDAPPPTLNLVTQCFTHTSKWRELVSRRKCLDENVTYEQLFSPAVVRKIELVLGAYAAQQDIDMHAFERHEYGTVNDAPAAVVMF